MKIGQPGWHGLRKRIGGKDACLFYLYQSVAGSGNFFSLFTLRILQNLVS